MAFQSWVVHSEEKQTVSKTVLFLCAACQGTRWWVEIPFTRHMSVSVFLSQIHDVQKMCVSQFPLNYFHYLSPFHQRDVSLSVYLRHSCVQLNWRQWVIYVLAIYVSICLGSQNRMGILNISLFTLSVICICWLSVGSWRSVHHQGFTSAAVNFTQWGQPKGGGGPTPTHRYHLTCNTGTLSVAIAEWPCLESILQIQQRFHTSERHSHIQGHICETCLTTRLIWGIRVIAVCASVYWETVTWCVLFVYAMRELPEAQV